MSEYTKLSARELARAVTGMLLKRSEICAFPETYVAAMTEEILASLADLPGARKLLEGEASAIEKFLREAQKA